MKTKMKDDLEDIPHGVPMVCRSRNHSDCGHCGCCGQLIVLEV
jgi:hypothetical protein